MRNFFEHQEAARRRSRRLVALYLLSVAAIIAIIYFAAVVSQHSPLWNPAILLVVTVLVGGVISIGTTYKIMMLRGGGSAVALSLGGAPLAPTTTDPAERRLLNIVEEMALASSVPVPATYVLHNETAINAFAAGYSPTDAVVGVTRGAIEQLNRDELQGVIAHEFSHILNGDMRLNIRLMGLLHGILLLYMIGRLLIQSESYSRRDRKNQGGIVGLGILLIVVGSLGVFFAKLLKASVSRQREFLADASAVQFTRNPDGIGGALKKIGGIEEGSRLEAPRTQEISHALFANGLRESFLGLFSTHPPLKERIRRILPNPPSQETKTLAVEESASARCRPLHATESMNMCMGLNSRDIASFETKPIDRVGTVSAEHLSQFADGGGNRLVTIRELLNSSTDARGVIYAMLIDSNSQVSKQQFQLLESYPSFETIKKAYSYFSQSGREERFSAVNLAIPYLRTLSPSEYREFHEMLSTLAKSDGKFTLFEFSLITTIRRVLDRDILKRPAQQILFKNISDVQEDIDVVLSLLDFRTDQPLERVQRGLERISQSSFDIRKQFVATCFERCMRDNVVSPEEAELLRAILESIDCPLPPMLAN